MKNKVTIRQLKTMYLKFTTLIIIDKIMYTLGKLVTSFDEDVIPLADITNVLKLVKHNGTDTEISHVIKIGCKLHDL